MSDAEDRIEEPFINTNMSFPHHHTHTAQKRKMSHSDHIDSGTPPLHNDPSPTNTSTAQTIKTAYNGPSSIFVVMLRVHNESSARPMPQAAFLDRDKALAFSNRVLLQWCEAHYEDYLWKGAESLRGGVVERYAAYHAQTGQQLAVADVVRVSVFDAWETEVVVKKEDLEKDDESGDSKDSEGNEKSDERRNAGHQEESEEKSEDTETTSSDSTQTQGPVFETTLADSAQAEEEEMDLETLSALLAHDHQAAPGMYATELATRLAKNAEQDTVSGSRRQSAWREDHEMRVFGGSTEHDTY